MRLRHFPSDSAMSRYVRAGDTFEVTDDASNVLLVLSGEQLVTLLSKDLLQAGIVLELAHRLSRVKVVTPPRRLLGQHKALRHVPHPLR
jgi:hypothetical protein